MSTPSIQTLITQAQQVLNLKSSNEIRATLAAVLANANVGTPLNPNLTTQQLWDEFYEIVRQPSDDIMSIITDQMMRMVFSPPAPGGAGADKQVIFNDGGVLAGDPDLIFNKALNKLVANNIETAAGLLVGTSATITGDLTVRTTKLRVTSIGVGANTLTPAASLHSTATTTYDALTLDSDSASTYCAQNWKINGVQKAQAFLDYADDSLLIRTNTATGPLKFGCNNILQHRIDPLGVFNWYDGAGGTRMTLNSTGLGIGAAATSKLTVNGEISVTDNFALRLGSNQAGGATLLYNGSGNLDITPRSGFHTKLVDGNLIIGTSGKGIDFSATANSSGTMTSELLNDYEEGTWTPVVTAVAGTLTSVTGQTGTYTKIGRMVTATGFFTITTNGTGSSAVALAGLPFANGGLANIGVGRVDGTNGNMFQVKINASASTANIWKYDNTYPAADGAQFPMTLVYYV